MTKPKSEPKPDDAEQSRRFIDMAREIGASESEADAKQAFRKVATNPKTKDKKPGA